MDLDLKNIQRLVLQGYSERKWSCWYFLQVQNTDDARTWIKDHIALVGTADVDSRAFDRQNINEPRLAIAVTLSGLKKLGLTDEELFGFSAQFRLGMQMRAPALGDVDDSNPQNWSWGSGPNVPDLLVILYSTVANEHAFIDQGRQLGLEAPNVHASGMSIVHRVSGESQPTDHFGFKDGIAQPLVEGSGTSMLQGLLDHDNSVSPGEFVFGYTNEAGHVAESPSVPANRGTDLPPHPSKPGRLDFGRNGSYLVVRQLEQHVDEFHLFIKSKRASVDEQALLAAKLVGRWKSGAPLMLAKDQDKPGLSDANDFMYYSNDRNGYICPIGSHIRRANPRDSLVDRVPGRTREEALLESNSHRLIRRGRTYSEGAKKGLMFACLNASIETQFEFVQQSWITNPSFGGLTGEDDPLVGGRGRVEQPTKFTIQSPGGNEEVGGLAPFVTVRGGAYFFMPSKPALEFLSRLK